MVHHFWRSALIFFIADTNFFALSDSVSSDLNLNFNKQYGTGTFDYWKPRHTGTVYQFEWYIQSSVADPFIFSFFWTFRIR